MISNAIAGNTGTSTLGQGTHLQIKAPSLPAANIVAVDKTFAVKNTPQPTKIEGKDKTVRAMSDVVIVYNQRGEARYKFIDSYNNVLYQIPPEAVAKMEDQMMNTVDYAKTKA